MSVSVCVCCAIRKATRVRLDLPRALEGSNQGYTDQDSVWGGGGGWRWRMTHRLQQRPSNPGGLRQTRLGLWVSPLTKGANRILR